MEVGVYTSNLSTLSTVITMKKSRKTISEKSGNPTL